MYVSGLFLCFTSAIIIGYSSAIYTKGRGVRFSRRLRSKAVPSNVQAPPTGQQIRLSHGEEAGVGKGHVEIFIRDKFGAICDNNWDVRDADVVCKQIGFLRGAIRSSTGGTPGKGSRYVMDNVDCDEHAQNVVDCDWDTPDECGTRKAAGVQCQPNEGCPDGWIAGPTGCYQILPNTVTRREFAVNKCAARGGHLINIETAEENHFISHVFKNESLGQILIGGVKVGRKWMWEKVSLETSDRDVETTTQVPIEEFNWFPGWQPGSYQAEPSRRKKERCLFLSNTFQHPNGSDVNVGYHFWLNDRCSSTRKRMSSGFRYICERPPERTDVGCYSGIGTEYRGTASFTKKGTPCMKWTEATDISPETYPGKGLGDHNNCRNPDNDEAPWCWISEGHFEFCNIPKCTLMTVKFEDTDTETSDNVHTETSDNVHTETSDNVHTESSDNVHTEIIDGTDTESSDNVHTESSDSVHTEIIDDIDTESSDNVHTESSDNVHTESSDIVHTEIIDDTDTESSDNVYTESSNNVHNISSYNLYTETIDDADIESSDNVHTETTNESDPEQSNNGHTESRDNVHIEPSDNVRTDSRDNVYTEPGDNVHSESNDNIHTETTNESDPIQSNNGHTESRDNVHTEPSDNVYTEPGDNVHTESNDNVDTEAIDDTSAEPSDIVHAESIDNVYTEPSDNVRTDSSETVYTEPDDTFHTESNDNVHTETTNESDPEQSKNGHTESNDNVHTETTNESDPIQSNNGHTESRDNVHSEPSDNVYTEPGDNVLTESNDNVHTELIDDTSAEPIDIVHAESIDNVHTEPSDNVRTDSSDTVYTEPDDTFHTESNDNVHTETINESDPELSKNGHTESNDNVHADTIDDINAESSDTVHAESIENVHNAHTEPSDNVHTESSDNDHTEPIGNVHTESNDNVHADTIDDINAESSDTVHAESIENVHNAHTEPSDNVHTESSDNDHTEPDGNVHTESNGNVHADTIDDINAESSDTVHAESIDNVHNAHTEPSDNVHTESSDNDHTEPDANVHTESNGNEYTETIDDTNAEPSDTIHAESIDNDHSVYTEQGDSVYIEPSDNVHTESSENVHSKPNNDDTDTEPSDSVHTEPCDNVHTESNVNVHSELSHNVHTDPSDNVHTNESSDNGHTETADDTDTELSDNVHTEQSDNVHTESSENVHSKPNNDDTDTEPSDNVHTEPIDNVHTESNDNVHTELSHNVHTDTSNNVHTKPSDEDYTAPSDMVNTESTEEEVSEETCNADEFRCNDRCIPGHWKCDMEPDCQRGEDEGPTCDYKLPLFKVSKGLTVRGSEIEIYAGSTNETCARYCLNSKRFVCRSFSFSTRTRECLLSHHNSETEELKHSRRENVFELRSQLNECDGMFRCNNGRCLSQDHVCDGVDHCNDFSDEENCGEDVPVTVRLMGGTKLAGRVEVFYKGEWGLICDDNWDAKDASVVCNMLGFTGSAEAVARSYYGSGEGNILLDEVECVGTETAIDQCKHSGWKNHDCYIWEVAAVRCSENKDPECEATKEFACTADSKCISLNEICDGKCQCSGCSDEQTCDSKVKLVGGDKPSEGRVEIVLNGIRGTICDDYFEDEDATVICRMLGYSWGSSVKDTLFGPGNGTIWMDDVKCIGNETDIITCPHFGPRDHNCGHDEDVGVICQTADDAITVELEDGSERSGRVILTKNNERGTICDDSWDDKDATVICRMLGFRDGKALTGDFYGAGDLSLQIFLDDVQCTGDEKSIELCSHSDWLVHNCEHKEDAGVTCTPRHDDVMTTTTSTTTETPSQPLVTTVEPPDCHNPDVPYAGRKAVTQNGFECQAWVLNTPHRHKHHNDSAFPDASVRAANNYCRSPDGDPVPWCYTTHPDERWGYCKVSKCKVDCYTLASEYTGPTSKTTSGKICQRWSSNTPHNHKYHSDENFPDASVDVAANHCRSPDGDVTPWCYTTNADDRWEYCNVSKCAGGFNHNISCGLRPLEHDRDRRDVGEEDESYGTDYLPYRKLGRIYGGSEASYGMHPWQAGIRRRLSGYLGYHLHHCGGTIIGEYWILTAAHCFRDASKGQVIVRTGDLNSGYRDKYEQEFDVDAIIKHERYDSQDYDYDIALLKLRPIHGRGIVFNDYVQPACLPNETTEYRPGYKCLISGWGEHEDDSSSVHMKAARIPIVDQRTCNKLYKQTITSNMACAGYLAGGTDTCSGDSGGPLVCKVNDKYTVMGVVSFGEGCAVPNAPGVYARVSAFIPWIKEKLSLYI